MGNDGTPKFGEKTLILEEIGGYKPSHMYKKI